MSSLLQRLRLPRWTASQPGISNIVDEARLQPGTLSIADEARLRREVFERNYPDQEAPGKNRIPPLPNLQDNGPYSKIRYISEDLFWNSALTEAGEGARIQVRPDHSSMKRKKASDTEYDRMRAAIRRQEEQTSYQKDYLKFTRLQAEAERQHAYENRDLGRTNRSRVVWGRGSGGNDRIIMSYGIPCSPPPPTVPLLPSRRPPMPLRPSTREWDEFMDIDTQEPVLTNGTGHNYHRLQQPASGEVSASHTDKDLPEPPLWYEVAYQPRPSPDSLGRPASDTEAALGDIVDHYIGDGDSVDRRDSAVNVGTETGLQHVPNQDRTTKGLGTEDHSSISRVAEGVAPMNDTELDGHKSASTAERIAPPTETTDREASKEETHASGQASQPPLTNGVHYKPTSLNHEGRTSKYINRSPSPYPPYDTSTPPDEDSGSRRSSTEGTSRSNESSLNLRTLLRTTLSPSELSLFNASAPPPHQPSASGPSSDSDLPRPVQSRLLSKCYSIIHHLQYRLHYAETIALPDVSEALDRKARAVDFLLADTAQLSAQVRELRQALDTSHQVFTSCFEREFEMYRTLATIRQGRKYKGAKGMLRRMGGKKRFEGERLDKGLLSPLEMKRQALLSRELDAVMVMAGQNIRILREDADEFVGRVDGVKEKFRGCYVQKEPEPGSWIDV